jgi:signal transduction histidine kinase
MTEEEKLGVRPDSKALVRALGLLYIGGPSIAVACQLLPNSPETDETAIWVMAVLAYAMVPVVFTQYMRLPAWAIGAIIAFANCLVTAVVYFNHEATSYYAFLYLWATPYAAIFFSARVAAGHLLFAATAYAVVLAVLAGDGRGAPGGAEAGHWLHTVGALAVTALLAQALTRALRENLQRIDQERRRRAVEINDDVVQRLVLARQCYADGEREEGDVAVDAALDRARRIMADLVTAGTVEPGSLRRDVAATAPE